MQGPFYNYVSKEGIKEDHFVDCATHDLIDAANQEVMRVLIVGKPRTGKTTLAKQLAERLDLVRISPEVWLNDLFARIKAREDDPPELSASGDGNESGGEDASPDPEINKALEDEEAKDGEQENKEA